MIQGFDPINLINVNIKEWLSNNDNIIIYTDEDNIVCLKKSYFNYIKTYSFLKNAIKDKFYYFLFI